VQTVITPVRQEDLAALCALEAATFSPENFPLSRKAFLYHIKRGNPLLVARSGAETAGYILLLVRKRWMRIYSLAVNPAYRGQGIGETLIRAAVKESRAGGKESVRLEVRTDNGAARALYAKAGFVEKKVLPGYYGDGTDGIEMVLIQKEENEPGQP